MEGKQKWQEWVSECLGEDWELNEESVIDGKHSYTCAIKSKKGNFFLKRIIVEMMQPRSDQQWKRDIKSYRNEYLFYEWSQKNIQGLRLPQVISQHCHYSVENLKETVLLQIIEQLEPSKYVQIGLYNRCQAERTLNYLAQLHGRYWGIDHTNIPIGSIGGFWRKEQRPFYEQEVNMIEQNYIEMKNNYGEYEYCDDIGRQLCKHARSISDYVTRLSDEYCTIIHGDCKTSNVFMSSDEIVPIDFQWTGWGNHMADVTYFLLQSVQIELLQDNSLLEYYYSCLLENAPQLVNTYCFQDMLNSY